MLLLTDYIREDRDTMPRDCAKGNREEIAGLIKGRRLRTRDARLGPSRESEGCGQLTGRIERAGPPPGGPVRSIRKNNVLPGSGPTDLHYGKNGYVPHNATSENRGENLEMEQEIKSN